MKRSAEGWRSAFLWLELACVQKSGSQTQLESLDYWACTA